MNRASITPYLSFALVFGFASAAFAQGSPAYKTVRRTTRATESNLMYQVRITPTSMKAGSTSIETGADTWKARGFDVKTLLAQIYDIDVRRVDLPDDGNADARYDLTVSLPHEVELDEMQHLLVSALEKKFGWTVSEESKALDVYVMSAPSGPGSELHRHASAHKSRAMLVASTTDDDGMDDAERITYMGKDCSGVSSGGIAVSAGTIADFTHTLEQDLDRVLVDETRLAGSYDFQIGNYTNEQELFKLLHEQLGLVVTPAQRNVTILAVRPAQSLQAQL
jgi:uncharacterized protein (TIGR03435 family)